MDFLYNLPYYMNVTETPSVQPENLRNVKPYFRETALRNQKKTAFSDRNAMGYNYPGEYEMKKPVIVEPAKKSTSILNRGGDVPMPRKGDIMMPRNNTGGAKKVRFEDDPVLDDLLESDDEPEVDLLFEDE